MKNLYSTLLVTVLALVFVQTNVSAQQELVFKNVSLKSGTAGADGAVYLFPSVSSTLDALVTINGRSSSLVSVSSIDLTSTGFDKAFQPQIQYNNGNVSSAQTWWMEFTISFVKHNTSSSSVIDSFNVTALDIDGNGSTLHEWDAFYSPVSYTLENPSLLQVTNLVVSSSNVGKTFTGDLMDHPGIDTSSTDIMTTLRYNGVSSIKIRLGATTTGSASTNRMYSIWFKNFSYNAPLKVLPVKLASFNATLNKNKVDLKWTTSSEQNVSHFVVERSFDGINFNDAGLVFAVGNSTQNVDYSFSDDISNVQANMIYYRLCSVDIDGKTDYSEVRVIRLNKQTDNSVTIITYPNPVNNELRITVPASWQNKKIAFELFNANGQLSKKTENASSSQTETINVSDLARGFYVVRVTCNGETAQQKIIKN